MPESLVVLLLLLRPDRVPRVDLAKTLSASSASLGEVSSRTSSTTWTSPASLSGSQSNMSSTARPGAKAAASSAPTSLKISLVFLIFSHLPVGFSTTSLDRTAAPVPQSWRVSVPASLPIITLVSGIKVVVKVFVLS